jgi:hypothetical protein
MAPAGAALGSSQASLGRGDPVREPDLGQVHEDLPASAKGRAGPGFKATVPVYFHVVTDGATGSSWPAGSPASTAPPNATSRSSLTGTAPFEPNCASSAGPIPAGATDAPTPSSASKAGV